MILAADRDTFFFDCGGLIKGILWGWNGDLNRVYGGAVYSETNTVPDIGADTMITKCSGISDEFDFATMKAGEVVWKPGHIGVYVGDGLAVECTPMWDNKVQITACNCTKQGYNRRNWVKHGKLPWINYETQNAVTAADLSAVLEKAQALVTDLQRLFQQAGG